jgi:tetratricopeptide (TPR) repeat protein
MRNNFSFYILILFITFFCRNNVCRASQNECQEHTNAGLSEKPLVHKSAHSDSLTSERSKALAALANGQYSVAMPILKHIVDEKPNEAMANWDYGGLLFASAGQYYTKGNNPPFSSEAIPILKEATVYLKKASTKFGQETVQERVLKSQAYYLLGDIYHYGFDSLDKAAASYKKAVEFNPKNNIAQKELDLVENKIASHKK